MRRTPLLTLVAAAAIGTTLVGCGGSDDGASGCTAASTVTVHAKDELKFDKDAYDATKGCVELKYVNDGSTAHTLLIKGVKDFSKLSIGKEDSGAVELDPGTYTLYCDISGHEAAGMEATLTVG
jgi:plastocyanin